MKSITLLMIVCALWHKSGAQSQAGGVEQYYYMNTRAATVSPIAWYQSKKGLYFEGRYNYDAEKVLSLYAGKTFEKESVISYSVSTLAGVLIGSYKGLSAAVNADLEYQKMFFSLQTQYTVSLKDRTGNYVYTWCDLGYQGTSSLSAGLSVQHTKLYKEKAVVEKGVFIKAAFGRWAFPLYFFNPTKSDRYTVLGLNFMIQADKEVEPRTHYL